MCFEAAFCLMDRAGVSSRPRLRGVGFADAEKVAQVGPQLLVRRSVAVAVKVQLEVVQDLGRRLVPQVAVALEALLDDGLEPLVDLGPERREARDRHRQDVAARLGAVGVAEDVAPEEDLREDDPQREEVGAGVGDGVARLLGREVLVLARDHLALLVVHEVEGLRYPEVRQLDVALVAHDDVLGADVAVDDV